MKYNKLPSKSNKRTGRHSSAASSTTALVGVPANAYDAVETEPMRPTDTSSTTFVDNSSSDSDNDDDDSEDVLLFTKTWTPQNNNINKHDTTLL